MKMSDTERPYLYKYMTFDTALICLASNKFRWSGLKKLNDPMDPFITASFGRNDPLKNQKDKKLRSSLSRCAVFCLSERNDNILMWTHYAEDHKGVVFQIDVRKFRQAYILKKAKLNKIGYVALDELPKRIPPTSNIAPRFFQYKLNSWCYEEEWRVIHPDLLGTSDIEFDSLKEGYRDVDFNPESIEAIFLGVNLEAQQEQLLLSVLNNHKNLNTKVVNFSEIDITNATFKKSHEWKYDSKEQKYVTL